MEIYLWEWHIWYLPFPGRQMGVGIQKENPNDDTVDDDGDDDDHDDDDDGDNHDGNDDDNI